MNFCVKINHIEQKYDFTFEDKSCAKIGEIEFW